MLQPMLRRAGSSQCWSSTALVSNVLTMEVCDVLDAMTSSSGLTKHRTLAALGRVHAMSAFLGVHSC